MPFRIATIALALTSTIAQASADCPADLDGDGDVGSADMGILLAAWGTDASIADLDEDGTVTGSDLALILASWGACPEPAACTGTGVLAYEAWSGGTNARVDHPEDIELETSTEIDCEAPVQFTGSLTHTTWRVMTYPVEGATLADVCVGIFDPITGAGPADGKGRHAGYTYGTLTVVIDCIELPIEQDLPTQHPWWTGIRGDVAILVPEWTGAGSASPEEAAAWSSFVAALTAHELEHAEIFDDMITVMLARHACDLPGLPWCLPTEIPMPLPALGQCTVGEGATSPEAIEIAELVAEWLVTSSDHADMKAAQLMLDAVDGHGPSLACE
ncbi:MAG: DUF922 domain-containing protein [Phycisphaera sp.]|nr:DUF922 domain-containing protein [Phycisphaera sp.]